MSNAIYTQKMILNAKQNNWPVGLYGLGQLGQDAGALFLNWIDLRLDFVCDKNQLAIKSYVRKNPGLREIDYNRLLDLQEHVLVFVCVGVAYIEEVCTFLAQNRFLHVITIDDIISLDFILENFYNIKNIREYALSSPNHFFDTFRKPLLFENERTAVYTCVTGQYDNIREPLAVERNCDYYLISDKFYPNLRIYQQINIADFIPKNIETDAEKNRWCKMHGHQIFKNYKHSIYIDGSIQLLHPVSHYAEQTGRSGIALHKHPLRNCIYEEGLRLIVNKRGNIDYQRLKRQMVQYLKEGMPREYGLFECGMIVRDHTDPAGRQIMHQWFEEYQRWEKRDQLSLTYILWKNGIASKDIGVLNDGQEIRKNPDIRLDEEHRIKG